MKIELYDDRIGKVELVDHSGTDLMIIDSARVNFDAYETALGDKDKKSIRRLVENQHTRNHHNGCMTFNFKVPLFVQYQHYRHTTWLYNEISRTYTDENLEFYEPKLFRTQSKNNRQASNGNDLINPTMYHEDERGSAMIVVSDLLKEHHKTCLEFYKNMMSNGVCREQARGVLPQNLYTEYCGTVNLNNLLKFIKLGEHESAKWEIVQVTKACREIALTLYPITLSAFGL